MTGVQTCALPICNIAAGEELNYDYGLIIDEKYTKKLKKEFACWCGSFGGRLRNRLFMCSYTSIYAIYVEAIGALRP